MVAEYKWVAESNDQVTRGSIYIIFGCSTNSFVFLGDDEKLHPVSITALNGDNWKLVSMECGGSKAVKIYPRNHNPHEITVKREGE